MEALLEIVQVQVVISMCTTSRASPTGLMPPSTRASLKQDSIGEAPSLLDYSIAGDNTDSSPREAVELLADADDHGGDISWVSSTPLAVEQMTAPILSCQSACGRGAPSASAVSNESHVIFEPSTFATPGESRIFTSDTDDASVNNHKSNNDINEDIGKKGLRRSRVQARRAYEDRQDRGTQGYAAQHSYDQVLAKVQTRRLQGRKLPRHFESSPSSCGAASRWGELSKAHLEFYRLGTSGSDNDRLCVPA